jgi:hypothetical protein
MLPRWQKKERCFQGHEIHREFGRQLSPVAADNSAKAMRLHPFQVSAQTRQDEPRASGMDVRRLEERLLNVERKIENAKLEGLPPATVAKLETQAFALQQILQQARLRTPEVADAPREHWQARLEEVRKELQSMGTGFELTLDPVKFKKAEALRRELLSLADSLKAHVSSPARAPQGVQGTRFVDSSESLKPSEVLPGKATPEKVSAMAGEVTGRVLGNSCLDHHFFYPGSIERFRAMAAACLGQSQGDVEQAKRQMEQALLQSPEGQARILGDVRFALRQGERQGRLTAPQRTSMENLLARLPFSDWISNRLASHPESSRHDCVQSLLGALNSAMATRSEPVPAPEHFAKRPVRSMGGVFRIAA